MANVINNLINQFTQNVNSGKLDPNALFQLAYQGGAGQNSDEASAAKTAYNNYVTTQISNAVQSNFGNQQLPAGVTLASLTNQAIANFENSGQWNLSGGATTLQNFLSKYNASPAFVGSQTSQAVAQVAQNQQTANEASLLQPGSTLYNTYFGNGGIVPTQEQSYVDAMQPAQQSAQNNLNATLAARGLATGGGAITAGNQALNQNYTNALNTAFQNIGNAGTQNLVNQAAGTAGATTQQGTQNIQAVTNAQEQAAQNAQAQAAQSATQKANGWSWLIPVAEAAATVGTGGAAAPFIAAANGVSAGFNALFPGQPGNGQGPTTGNQYGNQPGPNQYTTTTPVNAGGVNYNGIY
jgi:hypothetical protein